MKTPKQEVTWEEAAQPCIVTPSTGEPFSAWLSKDGVVCLSEYPARWRSCTIKKCDHCGVETHEKHRTACQACGDKILSQHLTKRAAGRPAWDGSFPVWLDDEFCDGEEDIYIYLDNSLEKEAWPNVMVYEAVTNNGREFGFVDFLDDDLIENSNTYQFRSPEAKELEAKVNAFIKEGAPYSYSCERPFALSSFSLWMEANPKSLPE